MTQLSLPNHRNTALRLAGVLRKARNELAANAADFRANCSISDGTIPDPDDAAGVEELEALVAECDRALGVAHRELG